MNWLSCEFSIMVLSPLRHILIHSINSCLMQLLFLNSCLTQLLFLNAKRYHLRNLTCFRHLKNKIQPGEEHRYHFFNSFFFRKLADLDKGPSSACEGRAAFQRVRKWTRKVNLFTKDYIFIPVNYRSDSGCADNSLVPLKNDLLLYCFLI